MKLSEAFNSYLDSTFPTHINYIYNEEKDRLHLFVSIANILENSLKEFIRLEPSISEKDSSGLYDMKSTLKVATCFSHVRFNGFIEKVRLGSNKLKHSDLVALNELDIFVIKTEFYLFLEWLFKVYFKIELPNVVIQWHEENIINKKNKIDIDKIQSLEIENLRLKNENKHLNLIAEKYRDYEVELVKEIEKLKKK